MNNIEVRYANEKDVDNLTYIQTQAWKNAFKDILPEDVLTKYTDIDKCREIINSTIAENKGKMYIALLDDTPLGELFWCNSREGEEDTAEIVALHTLPIAWGKGVGKALFQKALKDREIENKKQAILWVFKDNIRARKFYEKNNFVETKEEKVSFGGAIEVKYKLSL